jgi:hypothetical protein
MSARAIVRFMNGVPGYTIAQFLEQFPMVPRDLVVRLLEQMRVDLERHAVAA